MKNQCVTCGVFKPMEEYGLIIHYISDKTKLEYRSTQCMDCCVDEVTRQELSLRLMFPEDLKKASNE